MDQRPVPDFAVFDDYRYSQRIAIVVRWFLLGSWFFLHNYRPDVVSAFYINNGLALMLSAVNGYVHWRMWKGRPITEPYVLGLSALDLTFITAGIFIASAFDNTFFVLYYPAVLGLALVAPSRIVSFGTTAIVAVVYAVLSISMEPGVVFDIKEEKILIMRLAAMFAVVAAGGLVMKIERDRRREAVDAERRLASRNLELEREAREVERAAQDERDHMAREIHDGIAQTIYALNLNLETAADLAAEQGGPLSVHLGKLVPLAKKTLLETRHYINDLRPLMSGATDLGVMAENQVREFGSISGTPVSLTVNGEASGVSVPVASGLYRILQEALANVLKHAEATRVVVELSFESDTVKLTVGDGGIGFDGGGIDPGYGLDNMRQRTDEMNGTLEISGGPGEGTTINVTLPSREV